MKMIPAKKLFGFSIFYLFAIFSALLIDRLGGRADVWRCGRLAMIELVKLTEAQKKSRRGRNIALGLVLAGLVILFYAITIIKVWHRTRLRRRDGGGDNKQGKGVPAAITAWWLPCASVSWSV